MDYRSRHRLEKFVGVDKPQTLTVSALETAEFTATRLRWNGSATGHPTQFDRADGYMICLQRRDLPTHPYWVDDRPMPMAPLRTGQFLLLDLRVQHSSLVHGSVDCVSIYTSRNALRQFQAEHDLTPNGLLHAPVGAALDDGVIPSLGECLLPALDRPQAVSQLFIDYIGLAALSHLTAQYGLGLSAAYQLRGGLAPWQERRAKEMLLANLDGGIGLEALAAECRLSRSHFARAFKTSTGASPLRWLAGQRIESAKVLLLNSNLPTNQIASACGFSDASHLSRAFRASTGFSPGAWRRAHRR